MKKLAKTVFAGLLVCATQTFALEITNHTKSTIETKLQELENGEKVYTITIDGKPVCLFDLFALGRLLDASDEEILAAMRNNPSFPLMPEDKAVFEYSEICSGKSKEKVIGVRVSGEESGFFCLDLGNDYPYDQVYMAEEINIKH